MHTPREHVPQEAQLPVSSVLAAWCDGDSRTVRAIQLSSNSCNSKSPVSPVLVGAVDADWRRRAGPLRPRRAAAGRGAARQLVAPRLPLPGQAGATHDEPEPRRVRSCCSTPCPPACARDCSKWCCLSPTRTARCAPSSKSRAPRRTPRPNRQRPTTPCRPCGRSPPPLLLERMPCRSRCASGVLQMPAAYALHAHRRPQDPWCRSKHRLLHKHPASRAAAAPRARPRGTRLSGAWPASRRRRQLRRKGQARR